ncbi:flagellar hook-associated protein FlgK [Marivivens donghaensis]|uniref:Flagellar hook-associated protein 1 n=1 Tax=Marivivens donghaensis TaxID=1699413 RepID=A0ABX0VTN1_9RHOB|nr:flagellar hook-associated protein FlgK [Marivivens donghaensis]NIY71377.1 flagellar hook-associated protein FlgK [Marivivens donghaensis]
MSLTHSLNNALSGITISAKRAEVSSGNIANAATPGYAKRDLAVASDVVRGGVRAAGVTRTVDEALLADRRSADTDAAGAQVSHEALKRLEMVIGGIDSETSISAKLADLETKFIAASADPSSELQIGAVVQSLSDLTATFHTQSAGIQALRSSADHAIGDAVERLNIALKQVEDLNGSITRAQSRGGDTTALQDQRQQVIDQIAEIVPIRQLSRDGGQVALMMPSGTSLLDGKAREVSFTKTSTIAADMTLASGALSGLTINERDIGSRLGDGALGTQLKMRDETLVQAQADLDALAADLIDRFAAADPSIATGQPSILTDNGGPLDPTDTIGLASRISVNNALSAEPWRLRDGIAAATAGPAGDNTQIDAWIEALDEPVSLAGSSPQSAAGLAADFITSASTARLRAEDTATFTVATQTALKEAELANGVDTDAEIQALLQIEKSYAANAKVIGIIDEMFARLLEI